MADYEPIAEYIPRIADWRDLPDTSTPVMAEDIEAWQERLRTLTAKVNEAGARANTSASGGQVLSEPAPKGTLYVHDGAGVVKLPPGVYGQQLSPDVNDARGVRWEGGPTGWLTPSLGANLTFTLQAAGSWQPLRIRRVGDRVDIFGAIRCTANGSATAPAQQIALPPSLRPDVAIAAMATTTFGNGNASSYVVTNVQPAGYIALTASGDAAFNFSYYII